MRDEKRDPVEVTEEEEVAMAEAAEEEAEEAMEDHEVVEATAAEVDLEAVVVIEDLNETAARLP